MTDEKFELAQGELSLLETLDHVLSRGLVIAGEITISVADVELLFLGLNVVLTSIETAHEVLGARGPRLQTLHQAALTTEAPEPERGGA
jgi:gas vesicle structural protein